MSAPFARDFGVVIGVGDYPEFEPLSSAKEDARHVWDWLVSAEGGGVPRANCELILSSAPPPEPEQTKIDHPLLAVLKRAGELADRGRRLYLYFSGHGMCERSDDVSLCLAGWSEEMRRVSLSLSEYLETLKQYGHFEQIVAWVDCCRIRSFNVRGQHPMFAPVAPSEDAGATRVFLAQASEFQGPAFEAKRGIFTQALLEGLNGSAAVGGRVTAARLAAHLRTRTAQLATDLGVSQRGVVTTEFDDTEDFDFGPRRSTSGESVVGGAGGSFVLDVVVPQLPGLRVSVQDAHGARLAESAGGAISVSLPPGTYVVRSELGALTAERSVEHHGASRVEAMVPSMPVAAPLAESSFHHEYYQDPARRLSTSETRPPLGQDPLERRAHLMIFVRALDESRAAVERTLGDGLVVLDGSTTLARLDLGQSKADAHGWRALAAFTPPGQYVLRAGGARKVHLAVHAYAGWSTQVFLVHRGEPRFEDASILLRPIGQPFDPYDPALGRTAAALIALQSGARVAPEEIADVLAGQFDDPVLGLTVGHLCLAQAGAAQLAPVLARLRALLGPQAADVTALEIAEAMAIHAPVPRYPWSQPPMLRAGLDVLVQSLDHDGSVLPPQSFVERVAMRARRGGAWTVWETKDAVVREAKAHAPGPREALLPAPAAQAPTAFVEAWVARTVQAARARGEVDVADLARSLGLPVRVIAAAMQG